MLPRHGPPPPYGSWMTFFRVFITDQLVPLKWAREHGVSFNFWFKNPLRLSWFLKELVVAPLEFCVFSYFAFCHIMFQWFMFMSVWPNRQESYFLQLCISSCHSIPWTFWVLSQYLLWHSGVLPAFPAPWHIKVMWWEGREVCPKEALVKVQEMWHLSSHLWVSPLITSVALDKSPHLSGPACLHLHYKGVGLN